MSAELKENLRRIVSEVSEVDEIPDDTDFRELGIDSMMGIEIVAEVERTYKISVPEAELKSMTSLTAVYELVKGKLEAATG
jgi:acyl carrier protein